MPCHAILKIKSKKFKAKENIKNSIEDKNRKYLNLKNINRQFLGFFIFSRISVFAFFLVAVLYKIC